MEKTLITTESWRLLDGARAGKKETREMFKYVHVDQERDAIIATNGRVMIKLPGDAISYNVKSGTYRVESAKKYDKNFYELILSPEDIQYPEWWKVFPVDVDPLADVRRSGKVEIEKDLFSCTLALVEIYRSTGYALSVEYLQLLGKAGHVYWEYARHEKAVYLKTAGATMAEVLIMPLRVPELPEKSQNTEA